jgi:hypothetical protein
MSNGLISRFPLTESGEQGKAKLGRKYKASGAITQQ